MDHKGTVRFTVVLSALMWLSACASSGTIVASPSVELTRVELRDANIHRQTFLLGFRIDNPNPFPLPIEGVNYQLYFDGEKFASGESIGSVPVPAEGEGSFAISVELDFLRSASHMSSLLSGDMTDVIAYELEGSLAVDIPLVGPIPFENSGAINLSARDW